MRNVVFVAPFFMETTLSFLQAAARHPGVRLGLVSQDAVSKIPPRLRRTLAAHEQVANGLDAQQIADAVRRLARTLGGPIHRLLGTLEHVQEQIAEVRELLGIEGMGVEAARNFRDKARMKNVLRDAGLPCARHRLVGREEDARAFVEEVGFPIVLKPPAGAGAKATVSVADAEALQAALRANPPHPQQPLLAEEFIRGEEHSFDAVSIGGRMVWHSLTHYLPTPLDVVRNPWMQWCVLLPREVDDPRYDDIRRVAADTLSALGMGTGICHLEWFRRADGSLAVNEVAARPGGAQISKIISYAHDMHFYQAWARVMIDEAFDPPARAYAAGAAFLRGQGQGRVRAVHGLDQAQRELGPLVMESALPRLGQASSGSYEGDGYVILRHRETEVVKRALYRLITTVRVELG